MAEWQGAPHTENRLGMTLTNLLGIYFSFAMWKKFEVALTELWGWAVASVILTVLFLGYQVVKADQKNDLESGYLRNPYLNFIKDENGVYQSYEYNIEERKSSSVMTMFSFLFILFVSELTWFDVFF
ncbi:MAG: hypothetical protein VW230_04465 [Candidatus Poseidoniales archaeon]